MNAKYRQAGLAQTIDLEPAASLCRWRGLVTRFGPKRRRSVNTEARIIAVSLARPQVPNKLSTSGDLQFKLSYGISEPRLR